MQQKDSTHSPTNQKKDSERDSRGYMDIIYEVNKEHKESDGLAESEIEQLKRIVCQWGDRKCLFLVNEPDTLKLQKLQQRVSHLESLD